MACLYALPMGCCEVVVSGPYDFYHDSFTDEAGTPDIVRSASIYLDPPDLPDSSADASPAWVVTIPDTGEFRNFQHKTIAGSICPLGLVAAEIAYLYLGDDGQHSDTHEFHFEEDEEGFVEVDDPANNIAFSWDAGGDPDGCVKFVSDDAEDDYTDTEQARSATGQDWTAWNVPSGATIDEVRLVSFKRRVVAASAALVAHTLRMRILNSSNAAILDEDLYDAALPTAAEGSFTTVMVGGDWKEVLTDNTSGHHVRFEIEYEIERADATGEPDEEVRIDEIELEIRHSGTTESAWIQLDAENEEVDWIVDDRDWFRTFGDDYPDILPIGPINLAPWSEPTVGFAWDSGPSNEVQTSATCAHSGGLLKRTATTDFLTNIKEWRINTVGAPSYAEQDASGILYDLLYSYRNWGGYQDGELSTSDLIWPFAWAPQSDLCLGWDFPHSRAQPELEADHVAGDWTVTPVANLYIGTYAYSDNEDYLGAPTIDGGVLWSFTDAPETGDGPLSAIPLHAGVNAFDALQHGMLTVSIAVVSVMYVSEWIPEPGSTPPPLRSSAESRVGWSAVIVDGGEIDTRTVFEATDLTTSANYTSDERDYYPFWIAPRVLQPTESAQGGGQRHVYFQRVPWDSGEAADYGSDPQLAEYDLKVVRNGTADYEFRSRWGRSDQSSGSVSNFDNTAMSTFDIAAVAGGDADGTVPDGTLTIVVEDDDTLEDAIYVSGTNTLTVHLDIVGGRNTMEDLAEVVLGGGDFVLSSIINSSDAIQDGNTGTCTMTGGDDTAQNGSVEANPPYVHDSSNRYFYVHNFRMRTPDYPRMYYNAWMISHDGEILNPLGIGPRNDLTDPRNPWDLNGDQDFSSVKHSELLDLCPEKEEI